MTRAIHPHLTPARRRYLEALADGQPRVVRGGVEAFYCRKLGWSSFAVRDLATGEVRARRPDDVFWDHDTDTRLMEFVGGNTEIITPEGLRVLGRAVDNPVDKGFRDA